MQVNIRIPRTAPSGPAVPFTILGGNAQSQVTVAIQ